MDTIYTIVFSVSRRRPGCVLAQAAFGGTVPSELFYDLFPAETWLVEGIGEDMRGYPATRDQLEQLSLMAHEATKKESER